MEGRGDQAWVGTPPSHTPQKGHALPMKEAWESELLAGQLLPGISATPWGDSIPSLPKPQAPGIVVNMLIGKGAARSRCRGRLPPFLLTQGEPLPLAYVSPWASPQLPKCLAVGRPSQIQWAAPPDEAHPGSSARLRA